MLGIGLCLKLLFAHFFAKHFSRHRLLSDYKQKYRGVGELISAVLSGLKVMKNCVTFLALFFHDYRRCGGV
jgi:hypothetical protein